MQFRRGGGHGNEKSPQARAVFEVHADHFHTGLIGLREPDQNVQVNRMFAGRNLEIGRRSHGKLKVSAEQAAFKTEDFDSRLVGAAFRLNDGGNGLSHLDARIAAIA